MSGCRPAFADLNKEMLGTVRFGNDSVAQIEGRGMVAFGCMASQIYLFTGVYYIP
jgi:hypothetical protein